LYIFFIFTRALAVFPDIKSGYPSKYTKFSPKF
jgi:hypothetical protein